MAAVSSMSPKRRAWVHAVSYTHLDVYKRQSYGIAMGFITYCIVKVCKGEAKKVHPILWVVTALFILNFILLAVI